MKHQQQQELHNLRAVYNRLGEMMVEPHPPQQPGLADGGRNQINPVMQENLN
jgi:hypothetical protein